MVRKRARRTPKPIISETKPGRRCERDDNSAGVDADTLANVSLKVMFCPVMNICSLNWVDAMKRTVLTSKVIVRKSIFDPHGSLGARMSIDLDTGVVSVSYHFVLQYDINK